MSDIIGTIVVALIGGAVVYITAGPALGATRSRKAVQELLEIRASLDPVGDRAHRVAVDQVLTDEICVLSSMGDTRRRLIGAALNLGLVLAVIASVTSIAPIFVP